MCSVGAATFFCCREAQSLCLSALQGFFFLVFFCCSGHQTVVPILLVPLSHPG